MRLPDLEAWAIFAAVVEHRSFSRAADSIGLSKATVSKAVARLETQIGQALFHRTSRRLALTEAGRALAVRAQAMVDAARGAEEAARDAAAAPAGRIRVAAPMSFGVRHVAPLLADFLGQYPAIEVELDLSDAQIDIVAGGFDVALRIADLGDSSLRVRRLCDVETRVVAAPAYLAAHGTPAHPGDLSRHRVLGYTNVAATWRLRRGVEELSVAVEGPLAANSGDALMPALLAGLGIARLPTFILGDALERGAVVEVLTDWRAAPVGLNLVTPPSTIRPARVEALIAFLTKRLRR